MLQKQEKITIISAYTLTNVEKDKVMQALKENEENKGKDFLIDYKVIGNIKVYI